MSGAFMLLAASTLTSCNDINDWETDSSYDRLFSPTGLSASPDKTDVELTWKAYPGSDYYVVELSTDSLYGLNEEIRANSLVFGQDASITSSTYTAINLNSDTKYFVRVKACSDVTTQSHWGYLEKFSFNTKSENILNSIPASDRGEDFIVLTWEAGAAATHITYAEVLGSDEAGNTLLGDLQTIDLTSDNIANGTATITGLKGSTGYQITILNNGHKRGTRTATTRMELPEAQHIIRLAAGETLTQDSLNKYSSLSSVTVRFADATEYNIVGVDPNTGDAGGLIIPAGMSITFYGAEGDSKAVLNMEKEVIMGGVHGYIRFVNLNINDAGAQYLFNQGADASANEVSFTNVTLNNFARSIVRFKDSKAITVDELTFDNCAVNNQGSGNYAFITLDGNTYTVTSIKFNNTILNTLRHNGILMHKSSGSVLANVDNIEFNNCTLYNYIGDGRYLVDAGKAGLGPNVTFNNSILAKTYTAVVDNEVWSSKSRGVRGQTPVVENSYMTVDGIFGSNAFKGCQSYAGTSDDLFTNPTAGDFSIKDSRFEDGIGAVIE